jgi:hypothetical protein
MSDGVVKRVEYWNPNVAGTVRTGATGHGESLTDMETYLLPMDRAREVALHLSGVAEGLAVRATVGQAGVTISPGTALDADGRLIVLPAGGTAIVDPNVDPDQIQDVPTVLVGADGITLDTTGAPADCLLTITWREVLGQSTLANAPALLHAPWLRLVAATGSPATGRQVALARVTLDAAGNVTGLSADPRRPVGTPTGRLELRAPRTSGGSAPGVDQRAVAELVAEDSGDVTLRLLSGNTPRRGLTIAAQATGEAALRLSSPFRRTYEMSSRADGSWRLRDLTGGADRVVVTALGGVGVGTGPTEMGLDVSRRMRVRQSGESSAGIWFWQDAPGADRAFVGMADDTHVGFWGNTGASWGMRMDTTTGEVLFSGDYGQPFGPSTLSLWGARIGDTGAGTLFIRSGGNTVAFDGGDNVGINTRTPQAPLEVLGLGTTAVRAQGGDGVFQAGVSARGNIGVMADGTNIGIMASSHNVAAVLWGNVRASRNLEVVGTLTKGSGGFKIDHPLDPGGKYLSHSFVESPEMLTMYAGTAVTDDEGQATVSLPGYFAALNRDHRFQLTPIGGPATAWVQRAVRDNAFTIRTDQPGVEVSWQVTGVRQDPWAEANRIRAEEDKPAAEQDKYLHPEMYDRPEHAHVMGVRPETGRTGAGGPL